MGLSWDTISYFNSQQISSAGNNGFCRMVSKEYFGLRLMLKVFFLVLAAMLLAGLYPFDFFPENRVRWLANGPGLLMRERAIW